MDRQAGDQSEPMTQPLEATVSGEAGRRRFPGAAIGWGRQIRASPTQQTGGQVMHTVSQASVGANGALSRRGRPFVPGCFLAVAVVTMLGGLPAVAQTGCADGCGQIPVGHSWLPLPFDTQAVWMHGRHQRLSPYSGYNAFRPYNYRHVAAQAQIAARWPNPSGLPYATSALVSAHAAGWNAASVSGDQRGLLQKISSSHSAATGAISQPNFLSAMRVSSKLAAPNQPWEQRRQQHAGVAQRLPQQPHNTLRPVPVPPSSVWPATRHRSAAPSAAATGVAVPTAAVPPIHVYPRVREAR